MAVALFSIYSNNGHGIDVWRVLVKRGIGANGAVKACAKMATEDRADPVPPRANDTVCLSRAHAVPGPRPPRGYGLANAGRKKLQPQLQDASAGAVTALQLQALEAIKTREGARQVPPLALWPEQPARQARDTLALVWREAARRQGRRRKRGTRHR